MLISRIDPDLSTILIERLTRNQVGIMLCDTMYGLVGRAPQALERIRAIKGRDSAKQLLELVPDVSWLSGMVATPLSPALARHWPGPLTLIFERRSHAATVALRIPDNQFLRELCRCVGAPIYSTSVNQSGEPPLVKIEEIRARFESKVDFIVDSGDAPAAVPSTIVDLTVRPHKIVRQGALVIPPEDLESE